MHGNDLSTNSFLFKCLPLLALLAGAGCAPVVWLPDSSGFVYKDPNTSVTKLVRLGKKTEVTELSKSADLYNYQPAVSPDGKQVALVALSKPSDKEQFVIEFRDMTEKVVKRSKPAPLPKFDPTVKGPISREFSPGDLRASLYWSPTGKHILLEFNDHLILGTREIPNNTAIYDIAADEFKFIEPAHVGLIGLPCAISHLLPDGSGFVGHYLSKEEPKNKSPFYYFTWDGKPTQLIMGDADLALWEKQQERAPAEIIYPHPGKWDKNVATIMFDGELRLDPHAAKATFVFTEAAKKREAEKYAEGLFHYCVYASGKRQVEVRFLRKEKESRKVLQVVELSSKKTREIPTERYDMVRFIPSPDDNYVASSLSGDTAPMQLIVVNSEGEIVFDEKGP